MIIVKYVRDRFTAGILAFDLDADGNASALGGIDPGADPTGETLTTLVFTPGKCRELAGWVHPDQIEEVTPGVAVRS